MKRPTANGVILLVSFLFLSMVSAAFTSDAASGATTGRKLRHSRHRKNQSNMSFASVTKSQPTATSSILPQPSGSGNGTTYTGDGTWFEIGLGSCGETNIDTDLVAALNAPQMDNPANPNHNPICGRKVKINNPANNKTVVVKVVDTCPPCLSGSIDLSPAAFSTISDLDLGRIKIDWHWV